MPTVRERAIGKPQRRDAGGWKPQAEDGVFHHSFYMHFLDLTVCYFIFSFPLGPSKLAATKLLYCFPNYSFIFLFLYTNFLFSKIPKFSQWNLHFTVNVVWSAVEEMTCWPHSHYNSRQHLKVFHLSVLKSFISLNTRFQSVNAGCSRPSSFDMKVDPVFLP